MNYPALALAVLVLMSGTSNHSQSALTVAQTMGPTRVTIENYTFKTSTITITAGDTVVWKNLDDDPHTVTAVDGSFDSKGLAQGDTFTHRFTKPGKYSYYCKVHPMMRGTIIVKESNS
jgi:plastocyanin